MDIITLESIVYVDLSCCDSIITLRVPGYLPLCNIYNVLNSGCGLYLDNYISNEEIVCAAGPLSSLDLSKPVFYYNIGSLEPPVDELDDFDFVLFGIILIIGR